MDLMTTLPWISLACWWGFLFVWLFYWRGNKENAQKQSAAESRTYRLVAFAGVVVMTGILRELGHPFEIPAIPLLPRSLGLFLASDALSLLGLALAIWARRTLGRNWSYAVTLKQGHELVTDGPYAAIRHPIYTAILLLFLGLVLLIPTPYAVIGWAFVFASCWIKLRAEEALMLRQFPESYPAYMARTRRLVPGVI